MNTSKSFNQGALHFVSVIIPVYNDSERLKVCLDALERQTYPKTHFEVIVVDNGSSVDIASVVARFGQAVFACEGRTGSYAARNKGISLAKGEVLAFADSDCIPAPDWIEKGVANLLSIPNIGLLGGKIECVFLDQKKPKAFEVYDCITHLDQKYWIEKEKIGITANVFTFKTVFEKAGLFNDALKSGGDREWGKRVVEHGYAVAYADDACVRHPARSKLRQHVKKQIRVAGGVQDLKSQGPLRPETRMVRDHWPLIRRIFRVISDEKISGSWLKIKVISVILFLYFVKISEFIRLRLGGSPTRS